MMLVTRQNGDKDEIAGRLERMVELLIENRQKIVAGHKTVSLDCHGMVVRLSVTEHCEPVKEVA